MTDPRDYALWHRCLAGRDTTQRTDLDETEVAGFWRIQGAKTKPDHPVAIYYATPRDPETVIWQVGRRQPVCGDMSEWTYFFSSTFVKCVAVEEDEYHRAMEAGVWDDGKPSWKNEQEQEHGTY